MPVPPLRGGALETLATDRAGLGLHSEYAHFGMPGRDLETLRVLYPLSICRTKNIFSSNGGCVG